MNIGNSEDSDCRIHEADFCEALEEDDERFLRSY